jgi:chemotaxis protein methyltransferase CheR
MSDSRLDVASQEVSAFPRHLLSNREFEAIRRLAYDKFGLDLKKGKEELVAARLAKKLREHQMDSFKEYYRQVLEDSTGDMLIGLIDALTTNHTGFMREPAHFDFLRDSIVPYLTQSAARRQRIEVWSAACSTGEEPYTIACVLLDAGLDPSKIRILATDISTKVLQTARNAVYPLERFREIPESWRKKYLMRGNGRWEGWFRMAPQVRQLVEFRRLNLIEPLNVGAFPAVFCRNVMIYFDKPTQEHVVNALSANLEPEGWLMVGHAESLTGIRHPLRYIKPAIYRKVEGSRPR